VTHQPPTWRDIARGQAGLISDRQLREAGVGLRKTAYRIASVRWRRAAPGVVATTTGTLDDDQRLWLGVLHGGPRALVAGVHALARAGLRNWDRDVVVILVPYGGRVPTPLPGYGFVRTRRDLTGLRGVRRGVPTCQVEAAALLFASGEKVERTAQGLLSAVVQQRLTTAEALLARLDGLQRLPRAAMLRSTLIEIAGGAHSVSELDIARMCRTYQLTRPHRQVRRRDADGRLRFTDCEWRLPDGRTLILEVDGAFHMGVESWEDDIARQRALSASDRLIVRCTSRELRDESDRVARDLRRLGVPRTPLAV
jgi:hypothetical protein